MAMLLNRTTGPPTLAGVLFGLAAMFLVDGIVLAQKEPNPRHHYSFTMTTPALFSTVALFLLLLVDPAAVREEKGGAKLIIFISWLIMFGSSIGALALTFFTFSGMQERQSAAPGISLVLYTALVPITSSIMMWSRGSAGSEDW